MITLKWRANRMIGSFDKMRLGLLLLLGCILIGKPPQAVAQFSPLHFTRSAPLHAQKIIYPNDWVFDALSALALEQGKLFFLETSITVAQVALMLQEIDEETLSPPGKILYARLREYLAIPQFFAFQSDVFSVGMSPYLEPELYYKTNSNLDWIYNRPQRQPFLSAPAVLSFSSYITLESEVYLGENRVLSEAHDNYFNFPFDKMIDGVQSIDTNLPKRAYISGGLPIGERSGINARFGIGDETLGRTKSGSIILSDHLKGVSYGSLAFYSPAIRYTGNIMEFEVNKYLYLHQFQMLFFNRLSLSLIEGVMVNAPLELRFLNPMMIFHGFTGWNNYGNYNKENQDPDEDPFYYLDSRIGSLLGITADFKPGRFFHIYALYAMNDISAPGENTKSNHPEGMGFQLGVEASVPAAQGYWKFGAEGVYTYPFMYVLGHKGWSFYRESYEVSNDPIKEWSGSPFGPDSAAAMAWVEFHSVSSWSLGLSYIFAAQGERSNVAIFDGDYKAKMGSALLVAPSGTPVYTNQVGLNFHYAPLDWIALELRPAYQVQSQYNHEAGRVEHGFEISASCRLTPPPMDWAGLLGRFSGR